MKILISRRYIHEVCNKGENFVKNKILWKHMESLECCQLNMCGVGRILHYNN